MKKFARLLLRNVNDNGTHYQLTKVRPYPYDDELKIPDAYEIAGYKIVTLLTCCSENDLSYLEMLSNVKMAEYVELHKLGTKVEQDIYELGTIKHPPKIITMEHIKKLIKHVSYSSDGLSMVCFIETVCDARVIGTAHAQHISRYQASIGREVAYDDAIGKLFELEVYHSKMFHYVNNGGEYHG